MGEKELIGLAVLGAGFVLARISRALPTKGSEG